MQLTKDGLRIGKWELEALLAFTNKDSSSAFFGVHFRAIKPEKKDATFKCLKARASSGKIAVDALGHNLTAKDQEWFVNRRFLHALSRLVEADQAALLKFSGASLTEGVVIHKDGTEGETLQASHDAANSNTSFADEDKWNEILKPPERSKGVKRIDVSTSCLRIVEKLGKAAGVDDVGFFAPSSKSGDRLLVQAEGDDTVWLAMVDPAEVQDGDEDGED